MTIDKEKLKALAEAANAVTTDVNVTMAVGSAPEEVKAVQDFLQQAMPKTILALLAEIERLEKFEDWFVRLDQAEQSLSASFKAERDQLKAENAQLKNHEIELKAENEVLRKQVADLSPFKNASPQDYRASNKCLACGDYHHGLGNLPCPRCTPVAQSAMAKEASHDHE